MGSNVSYTSTTGAPQRILGDVVAKQRFLANAMMRDMDIPVRNHQPMADGGDVWMWGGRVDAGWMWGGRVCGPTSRASRRCSQVEVECTG